MPSINDALISIRPNYAEAILSGDKTVEIRRRIPAIDVGTRLWIYATHPVRAVVGSAVVVEVIEGSPDQLWESYMDRIAVAQCEYDEYFSGKDRAFGIALSHIIKRSRIGIKQLREIRNGFHPPRVLVRLSRRESDSLSKLAVALG